MCSTFLRLYIINEREDGFRVVIVVLNREINDNLILHLTHRYRLTMDNLLIVVQVLHELAMLPHNERHGARILAFIGDGYSAPALRKASSRRRD